MTSKKQHLHPLSLIFDLLSDFKSSFFIFLIGLAGLTKVSGWLSGLIIGGLILIFLATITIDTVRYFKFTYEITAEQLQVNSGIIEHKKLYVPYERIQTIKKKQWFFLKRFHLVSVAIETAGSEQGEAEINLTVVPESVLVEIETNQQKHHSSADRQTLKIATDEETAKEVVTTIENQTQGLEKDKAKITAQTNLSSHDLLIYGLTSLGIIPSLIALLGIFDRFDDLVQPLPKDVINAGFHKFVSLGLLFIGVAILGILLILMLVSLILVQIKYYHFILSKRQNNFLISRGFFQRSEIALESNRIQGIKIKQQLLRRLFGLVTVSAITATNTGEDDGEHNEVILLPVVQYQDYLLRLHPFLEQLPEKKPQPLFLAKQQRRYFLRYTLLWSILPACLLSYFGYPWGLFSWLIVLWFLIGSFLKFKNTAYQVLKPNLLFLQSSSGYQRTAFYIERAKIQSLSFQQTYWMSKKENYHLEVVLKAGSGQTFINLRYLSATMKREIETWYQH